MPYYEVTVTVSKCVCVKADDENEAEEMAADKFGADWNEAQAKVKFKLDEVKDSKIIAEYKADGACIKWPNDPN